MPVEENGVRLLRGPTGGGCAMTARKLIDRVGGFRKQRGKVFWLEDQAYIEDIARIGFEARVLPDLVVKHTGGPHYTVAPPEKKAFWERYNRRRERRASIKRWIYRTPLVPRLNARFGWFQPPT